MVMGEEHDRQGKRRLRLTNGQFHPGHKETYLSAPFTQHRSTQTCRASLVHIQLLKSTKPAGRVTKTHFLPPRQRLVTTTQINNFLLIA